MTATRLAANAETRHSVNSLLASGDRFISDGGASAHGRSDDAVFSIDIAPGQLGAMLPEGGWAIVDGADRAPVAGGVYWVIVNGDPAAMRCVSPDPRSFIAISEPGDDVPPAPVSGRAIWAVLGRVISYGREIDGAELSA